MSASSPGLGHNSICVLDKGTDIINNQVHLINKCGYH